MPKGRPGRLAFTRPRFKRNWRKVRTDFQRGIGRIPSGIGTGRGPSGPSEKALARRKV